MGPAALMTYTGNFDRPGQLRLYRFVYRGITGSLSCFPVTALAIDDGYPDNWGGSWGRWAKTTRYYFDTDNVTVSPDGSVTEFAAATAVYGVPADNATAAYPPPVETPFGRSEYRYHNDRTPRELGLVPDNAAMSSAAEYYSFLNGSCSTRPITTAPVRRWGGSSTCMTCALRLPRSTIRRPGSN